ncbi:MFS general substrate transporter [Pyrrhoderma noxium]|uniref:MFS general substrate transporter n=1 Tax=Pyrrhoderma noxium TaxID=2282107 RepID=A0A286UJR8_9AGAM|nr:MFS general substrate transporter [Pyrrhoderma noxium]
MISWPLLIASTTPSAWADNLPVIMIFRFLSGCMSACPLNKHHIRSVFIHPRKLGKAIGYYSFTPLSGPILGSTLGPFIAAHLTHGLWVIRVHWIMVIVFWPLVFFLPETYGPTILTRRAKELRKQGEKNTFAAHELEAASKIALFKSHIGRPITMLLIEPIIIGAAIWVSLAYSIIYFFFEAYPVVFVDQNNFEFQLAGLPFLAIYLGMFICVISTDILTQKSRHVEIPFVDPPHTGTPSQAPEAGLKVVLIACFLMPISMFWFAWTSKGNIHWISPTLAGIPFGYSMLSIFYAFSAYSTRNFGIYSSSASASNTLARSIIASIFPILAHPILEKLGTDWGVSLFGFLSLGLIPIPILFVRYGPALRKRSRFIRESMRIEVEMRHRKEEEKLDRIEAHKLREGKDNDENAVISVESPQA